jgi:hypothetical protein
MATSFPLYGCAFLNEKGGMIAGGGGGRSKTGVGNGLVVLPDNKEHALDDAVGVIDVCARTGVVAACCGPRTHLFVAGKGAGLQQVAEVATEKVGDESVSQRTLAFSQDGKRVATGGTAGVVKVLEVAGGAGSKKASLAVARAAGKACAPGEGILDLCFSPGAGELLASVAWDKTLRLWAEAGSSGLEQVGEYKLDGYSFRGVRFLSKDALVVLATKPRSGAVVVKLELARESEKPAEKGKKGGEAKALPAVTVREVHRRTVFSEPLVSMAVSPDGARIAAGSGEGHLVQVDARDLKVLATTRPHEFFIPAIAISKSGVILSVSGDRTWAKTEPAVRGRGLPVPVIVAILAILLALLMMFVSKK